MSLRPRRAKLRPMQYIDAKGGRAMFEVTARLKIRDGELEGFKRQAAEMMRIAREKDTRTLRYDWFVSDDGTRVRGAGGLHGRRRPARARA